MIPSKVFKTNLGIKIAVLGKNQTQVKNYYLSKRFEDQLSKKIEGSLTELYLLYFHLLKIYIVKDNSVNKRTKSTHISFCSCFKTAKGKYLVV